jgi:hypothetical protein
MSNTAVLLTLAAASALCACGSLVTLKDPQSGQTVACRSGAFSTGMTSQRVNEDLMRECVDGYTQQGYEIVASKP